jgi:hypothetical protein
MADYIKCQGCNKDMARRGGVDWKECNKCRKILCETCGGSAGTYCKNAPKGTPGCTGTLQRTRTN